MRYITVLFYNWENYRLPLADMLEANYQYLQEDGVSEGHQFQMRRMTLFVSSSIS